MSTQFVSSGRERSNELQSLSRFPKVAKVSACRENETRQEKIWRLVERFSNFSGRAAAIREDLEDWEGIFISDSRWKSAALQLVSEISRTGKADYLLAALPSRAIEGHPNGTKYSQGELNGPPSIIEVAQITLLLKLAFRQVTGNRSLMGLFPIFGRYEYKQVRKRFYNLPGLWTWPY